MMDDSNVKNKKSKNTEYVVLIYSNDSIIIISV